MKLFKFCIIWFLLSACGSVQADWQDITFTSNGTIQDGDQYVSVFANNNADVSVLGGQIGSLFCKNTSRTTISGGTFRASYFSYHPENNDGDNLFLLPSQSVVIRDTAIVDITGGDLETVSCADYGTVNVYNGEFGLDFSEHANVNIFGGTISLNPAWFPTPLSTDSVMISLHGGTITGSIQLVDNDQLHVYGYGFNYDPNGGDPGGILSGYWADGSTFQINFNDMLEHSYDKVTLHEVPEPGGLLLLGISALFLRISHSWKNN